LGSTPTNNNSNNAQAASSTSSAILRISPQTFQFTGKVRKSVFFFFFFLLPTYDIWRPSLPHPG
jgi:hypothetical protein